MDYRDELHNSIDTLYRTKEGQFFLQHIIRTAGLFSTAGDVQTAMWYEGRRALALELLEDCRSCRNGQAIVATVLGAAIQEIKEEEDDGSDFEGFEPTVE